MKGGIVIYLAQAMLKYLYNREIISEKIYIDTFEELEKELSKKDKSTQP